jgi:hypothetical protein
VEKNIKRGKCLHIQNLFLNIFLIKGKGITEKNYDIRQNIPSARVSVFDVFYFAFEIVLVRLLT